MEWICCEARLRLMQGGWTGRRDMLCSDVEEFQCHFGDSQCIYLLYNDVGMWNSSGVCSAAMPVCKPPDVSNSGGREVPVEYIAQCVEKPKEDLRSRKRIRQNLRYQRHGNVVT